jgi:hypothetical protein
VKDQYELLKKLGFRPPNLYTAAHTVYWGGLIAISDREVAECRGPSQLKELIAAKFCNLIGAFENSWPEIHRKIRAEEKLTPDAPIEADDNPKEPTNE